MSRSLQKDRMDWENKFTSILRETESNLSKARRKLYRTSEPGYSDWTHRRFASSLPLRRTSSLLDVSGYHHYDMSGVKPLDDYNTQSNQQLLTNSIQEKMEQQNKLIDQLMQMVNKLEIDRNNYSEQMRDIKDQLYQMRPQHSDRRPENIDSKLDQLRRDLQNEINTMHTQLHLYRSSGESSLQRDIRDIKNSIQDDLDLVKREVEIIKSRISKLENDIHVSTMSSSRRVTHDATVDLTSSRMPSLKQGMDTFDRDRYQLNDLRSTVSTLKGKLDNLEYTIGSGILTPHHKYTSSTVATPPYVNEKTSQLYDNGYKSERSANSVMDLDDLDLSDDDESTDFEMFNPRKAKISSTVVDSDEDLNLSDLDLSDDEPIGRDLLI